MQVTVTSDSLVAFRMNEFILRFYNKVTPYCIAVYRLRTFIRTTEERQENNYTSKYVFKYYAYLNEQSKLFS